MPPLPPVTDPPCLRVEFKTGDEADIEAGSRFFLSYSGSSPSVADLNTLATAVKTAWADTLANYVPNTWSLHGVVITDLSADDASVGEWSGTQAGLSAMPSTPASTCVVVNHQITRRYRGGQPKTFVRMGTTDQLSGTNQWNNTALGDFLTQWEAFIAAVLATTGIGITDLSICNISYYSGFTAVLNPITGRTRDVPKLRTDGPRIDPIVSSTIATKLGSQRRRLNL